MWNMTKTLHLIQIQQIVLYISTGKGDEIEHSQLGYDHNFCAESFRSLIGGGRNASPIQLYPVNVSQIMLMTSGDVEPNPGPNPRFVKDIVVKSESKSS